MIPRLGLEMTLPGTLNDVLWLGRGPGGFADSKTAARFGLWRRAVDDLFTNYVVPQGERQPHRHRWAALTNEQGAGLLAVGAPTLDFSAHRYTTEDLDRARHTSDLSPRDTITLHLDWRQNGIGSNGCGPALLERYQLHAEPFVFRLRLRALTSAGLDAPQSARQLLLGETEPSPPPDFRYRPGAKNAGASPSPRHFPSAAASARHLSHASRMVRPGSFGATYRAPYSSVS